METMQMLGRWSASAPLGAQLLAFNAAIAAAVGVLRPLAAALGVLREWPAVTSAVTAQAQEQEQEQEQAKAKAQARSVAPPAREPAPIEFRQDQQPGPLLASRDPSTVVVGMGMGMDMDMDMDQLESVDAAQERVEHWRHFRSDGQPLSCWVFAHDATKARLAASTLARQACDRVVVAG